MTSSRAAIAHTLESAYVRSFDAAYITVNTEGAVTAYWPDQTMQREFLLAPEAPAPVIAFLDIADAI